MIGGALHVPGGVGALVRVTSQGPFAVGSTIWRDARGQLTCSVVAKVTYELAPGASAPLDAPRPIQEEERHWDDDPSRSVQVPSDLAPFKPRAEVVVVGSAFAATPAASLVARVVVGAVDKSIETFSPRHFRPDGTIGPGARLPRFSLRYERAAGGPGTDNPCGLDVTRADGQGRLPVPQILPPSFLAAAPGEHVPTCGLGPIASTWPSRALALSPNDRAWLRLPAASPLPPTFPANFFQAAPPDQWLDRPLAANERIVLEGLHPEVRRLVMSLSNLEPRAVALRPVPEAIRLAGDLLFVDTDQGICTLTFRGQIPLDEGAGALRVIVVGVPSGVQTSPEDLRRMAESDGDDVETTYVEGTPAQPSPASTGAIPARLARPVLPFADRSPSRPAQPGSPDGALPFRSADAGAPPRTSEVFAAPARVSLPAAPEPPAVSSPAPVGAPPFSPMAPAVPSPRPSEPAAPHRASLPSGSFDAAFGGVRAASDAAAKDRPATDTRPVEAPRARDAGPGDLAARRQAVVSLVHFDARIVPRIRGARRFAGALAARARPRRAQGVDEPHQEAPPDDRLDVLRVLSCGRAADAGEIHRALSESLDDLDDLDPPILLVAGELRPTFDEVEVLRATAAIAQQVAGGDKKVLSAIAVGQEALAAPIAPRPETTLGLVRQIEQAAGSLSLPPRYLPSEVERVLVEGRKYKRRPLLGESRVRADLSLLRGAEVMPLYLPDAAAASLPLLVSFPVVALCEITPREDLGETQDLALVAVALGRVLRSR